MKPVHIGPSVLRDVLEHARRTVPEECCGLLLGAANRIETAYPARNVFRSQTRFQVHPADHFAAIRLARAEGRAVVGAYHSHPKSSPRPSLTDEEEAVDTEFWYLIVSPAMAETRAYRLIEGSLVEVELHVVEGKIDSSDRAGT